MLRYLLPVLILFATGLSLMGQEQSGFMEGKVSYITSQSVYVRFNTTEGLSEGDTLYDKQGGQSAAVLRIKSLSSISCVCIPLGTNTIKVLDPVYARMGPEPVKEEDREMAAVIASGAVPPFPQGDTLLEESARALKWKQDIHGRISVSSYTNFSNNDAAKRQRMRYTFSMDANHLGNSGFSVESYFSFAHSNSNWDEVKENIFNGLKIYKLALKYDFNESMHVSLGRKINPMLSSVGAIDGLQFEKKFKSMTMGAFVGSRPDYKDYSINPGLFQYGAYLGHDLKGGKLSMQNSLAFVEQTNNSHTDRRFVYLQHNSWLMKNISLFGSAEMDLYKRVNEVEENTFTLSNVYLSLRYRIIRQLSVGLSYSSRQNVIYYETYKDFVERLLDNEALQGWRFRVTARPVKSLSIGVNAGYRYRKEDLQPSRNINGYATYSRIPWIRASVTLSATWLETNYVNGNIYSLGLSKDIIPRKLSGGLKYRYVDYLYLNSETGQAQNVFEANLSWNIYKKLSLSVYYEGTFESEVNYNRLYINLSQRF